jgi:RNA polymerase sigma-70 factor (ECF subfamily)
MSFSFINNAEFIESLKKGDEKAYVYLVKTYHKPLFIYALSLTNVHDQSEDITQTVFLKTWEFRKKLNTNYSIKSFLYKSIYNEFINQYHKNRAISILEKVYAEALKSTVKDENIELLERKISLVTKGIKNLPRKCKETFLLSKKEGLTNIEIAEHLNISIKTVEGQITKAYHLLRRNIGTQFKEIG